MALIAAQMFTLRDYCKDEQGIIESCKKVKKMGYDGVQLSGIAQLDPAEMHKILDGEGLTCVVTHRPMQQMEEDIDSLIEEHHTLQCQYTAVGSFTAKENSTSAVWADFITRYNAVAQKLEAADIRLGYHNHSHEFAPFDDNAPFEYRRPIDLLISNFAPRIWFELDTYWVAHGGSDPAAMIRKLAGRIPLIHFKDMTITAKREQKMTEIGDGNLNWFAILDACRYAAVKWYIVERDKGDRDAFDSLERSIKNMRGFMGL